MNLRTQEEPENFVEKIHVHVGNIESVAYLWKNFRGGEGGEYTWLGMYVPLTLHWHRIFGGEGGWARTPPPKYAIDSLHYDVQTITKWYRILYIHISYIWVGVVEHAVIKYVFRVERV